MTSTPLGLFQQTCHRRPLHLSQTVLLAPMTAVRHPQLPSQKSTWQVMTAAMMMTCLVVQIHQWLQVATMVAMVATHRRAAMALALVTPQTFE